MAFLAATIGCTAQVSTGQNSERGVVVDSARVVADLRYLSGPELGGRASGTAGNLAAREYVEQAFRDAGLQAFDDDLLHRFPVGTGEGANVVGFVFGSEIADRYIVITAHYDHLGVRNGAIYHGADDNASGTAALLEIARHFADAQPRHSIIFAALDAEENGLRGARAFVADPPVPRESFVLNVNMDMISRNDRGEIYAAGVYHTPELGALVDSVAGRSEINVLQGHDRPGTGSDDWTLQSDHGAFHEAGIPFIYFGVEDHPDYHRPTDTFEKVDQAFFVRAAATVLDFVRVADQRDW